MSAPMVRVTLRGLWFRRRRLVGLFMAVFLGVAFLAGILGLSATMTDAINTSYQTANRGVDAIVRSETEVASGADEIRGPIPVSVLDAVRSAPGVADAQAEAKGVATITGADGNLVTGLGPRDAGTWIADAALNPWRIVAGSAPRGPADVVIDKASATAGHLTPGSTTTVYAPDPVRVTVAGIATYGGQDANGGSSYVAFTLAGAQRTLLGDSSAVSDIVVRADTGVAEASLVAAIRAALPDGVEAISGRQATRDQIATVDDGFLRFFKAFLDIFAGIALLVAALSIHNTFSVVAAGRARELALLRVLGAQRSQALRGLVLEAAMLGLAGSVAGVAAGYGMAAGLKGAFAGLGLPLPLHGVVFTVEDALIAVGVGVMVTVVATLSTAVRVSRTPPLAALTAVAVDTSATSRARPVGGLAVTAAGAVGTAVGAAGSSDIVTGVAAVATLVGLIILGPATCAWAARVAGRLLRGANRVNARIAQRNVLRSPARVASAGAALMVGVALVAMFAVIGASISASTTSTLGAVFTGDLVVSGGGSEYGNSGFSPQVATGVAAVPGVGTAAGVGTGRGRAAGCVADGRRGARLAHRFTGERHLRRRPYRDVADRRGVPAGRAAGRLHRAGGRLVRAQSPATRLRGLRGDHPRCRHRRGTRGGHVDRAGVWRARRRRPREVRRRHRRRGEHAPQRGVRDARPRRRDRDPRHRQHTGPGGGGAIPRDRAAARRGRGPGAGTADHPVGGVAHRRPRYRLRYRTRCLLRLGVLVDDLQFRRRRGVRRTVGADRADRADRRAGRTGRGVPTSASGGPARSTGRDRVGVIAAGSVQPWEEPRERSSTGRP